MEVAIVLSTILFVILTVSRVTKASIPNPVYINERGKWFLFILTYTFYHMMSRLDVI